MIPIVINNFNRLSTTRRLVDDLHRLGYRNIHILDNNSTYQPLLDWYNEQGKAKVFMLHRNYGPRALWDSGHISVIKEPWHVYTDSDIQLNSETPEHFIEHLIDLATEYGYTKAGLALKIDDIDPSQYGWEYYKWEQQFWQDKITDTVFKAQIDTTFAVQKTFWPFTYDALRVAGKLEALHIPWYTFFNNLSPEEKYFLDQSNDMSTYKKHYLQYLRQSGEK